MNCFKSFINNFRLEISKRFFVAIFNVTCLWSLVLNIGCTRLEYSKSPDEKIVIVVDVTGPVSSPSSFNRKDWTIAYLPLNSLDYTKDWNAMDPNGSKFPLKWIIYSKVPLNMFFKCGKLPMVCPGDSIHFTYDGKSSHLSGKGSAKITIMEKLTTAEGNIIKPTPNNNTVDSVGDYLQWSFFADRKLSIQMAILDSNKTLINEFEYEFIKSNIVSLAENDRINAFISLFNGTLHNRIFDVQLYNLGQIFDSTQYKPFNLWLHSQTTYLGSIRPIFLFNCMEVQRQTNFNIDWNSNKPTRSINYRYYNNAKRNYKGLMRERLLARILKTCISTKLKPENDTLQLMLKDYYNQSDYPEFKNWIKEIVESK